MNAVAVAGGSLSADAVLRGLLDEAHEGLLALDETGTIVEANTTAAVLLGHRRHELIGKPLAARIALGDRRTFRAALASLEPGEARTLDVGLTATTAQVHVSLRMLTPTPQAVIAATISSHHPVRVDLPQPSATAIEYLVARFPHAVVGIRSDLRVAFANGRAESLLGREAVRTDALFGDEVPRKLQELARKLVTSASPLSAHAVELADGRTLRVSGLALAEDEPAVLLIEDVSEQQRQSRVMHEFLRNAAHQLRTPLTAITAAVEMLQSGAKERPADRDLFLGHIETHARRLTRLARGLLLLARAQTGESLPVDNLELRPFLDGLVREVPRRGDVDVRVECDPQLAAIAAPDLLREALMALVENAVDHTSDGEVRLSANRGDGVVVLGVADSGPGILPEFSERLFEPFFRLAPSGEGYGLGLTIAAEAVRAMHGRIDVSSTPGVGTVFRVHLPAASRVSVSS
jgi:signal transduction histidine kinase